MLKPKNVGELNTLYSEADTIDKALFAEQRSNVLLVAGDHYNRNQQYGVYRRDNRDKTKNSKIRLTQNWTHKVHRRYVSAIGRYASGVTVSPNLDSDRQNQKSAELNNAVYQHSINRYRLKEKNRRYISDFVTIGECAVKLFWDPDKGPIVGYEQKLDDFGQPEFDPMTGQPVQDENLPQFQGEFVFERLFGFNLMRAPQAKSWEESPYIISRKMAELSDLRHRYKGQEDILKSLSEGKSDEYVIFDSTKGGYDKTKGQVPIREYFFRPTKEMPKGYFFVATNGAILEEGELPYGVFPIAYASFDEHPTSPRGRSIIKQVRPYQAELNRASSSMAQHQITIGDDKVLYQAGTKLAPGALLPGVRGMTYQGMAPTILPGRDGSQYQNYITTKKDEMFDISDTFDVAAPNNDKGGTDIYAMLFKSAAQRENLSTYSEKYEQFRVDLTTIFLELARKYYDESMLIPAIGKREYVNIAEFQNTDPLDYSIKIEPMDETLETRWGKQLTLQQMMQYAGSQMDRSDIGLVMKNMPYANSDEIFNEMTLDYDNARNTILSLERGQPDQIDPEENHGYMIKKLTSRMKESDFQFLDPQIQQMFQQRRAQHNQIKAQQDAQALAANSDYIPVDGAKIGVDMYVEDKMNPEKAPKRARIPQSALQWLQERIEQQSGPLMELNEMQPSARAEYGAMQQNRQGAQAGQPQQPPQGMPPRGM